MAEYGRREALIRYMARADSAHDGFNFETSVYERHADVAITFFDRLQKDAREEDVERRLLAIEGHPALEVPPLSPSQAQGR